MGNCFICFHDPRTIRTIADLFDSYIISECALNEENSLRILNISANIEENNNLDKYVHLLLISKLCASFVNANNRHQIKINLDIPNVDLDKDYETLCSDLNIPRDYFVCDRIVEDLLEQSYPMTEPIQIEFGSGYNIFSIGQPIKNNARLVFVDPIFPKTKDLHMCLHIKSKINDLLEIFLKFPTRSKHITRILTSRTLECLTLRENDDLITLLSNILVNEFICIVTDFHKIMENMKMSMKSGFCNANHLGLNGALFGFKDWDENPEFKTIWTKEVLDTFLNKLKKSYKKIYKVNSKINIVETELQNKKWFYRGELILK